MWVTVEPCPRNELSLNLPNNCTASTTDCDAAGVLSSRHMG